MKFESWWEGFLPPGVAIVQEGKEAEGADESSRALHPGGPGCCSPFLQGGCPPLHANKPGALRASRETPFAGERRSWFGAFATCDRESPNMTWSEPIPPPTGISYSAPLTLSIKHRYETCLPLATSPLTSERRCSKTTKETFHFVAGAP